MSYKIAAISMLALALASSAAAPSFEVVSFKHTANVWEGGRIEGGRHYTRPWRNLEYKGVKLSGETMLWSFFQFAFSPLVKPWRFEGSPWINNEYYQIEAIAPPGTSLDGARAMLRATLTERLGLQYHLVDRETAVYVLVRSSGPLRLAIAKEPEPNPGQMQMGKYIRKSATLTEFAAFLSGLAGREVVDKTGISGQFRFDVDWSQEMQLSMSTSGRGGDPGIAIDGVKRLGLKLEPGKEPMKVMVVDRLNREPTPN